MFCESYERPLKDAAASGELSAALRRHLETCSSCRAGFTEEQSLFAAIDSTLCAVAHAEVPATLVPRVRVALNNESIHVRTSRFWLLAAAPLLAAGLLALIYLRPHNTSTPAVATENAPSRGTSSAPLISSALNPLPQRGVIRVQHGRTASAVRNQASGARLVEVIVEPQEAAALLRYEASLRKRFELQSPTALAKAIELPSGIQPLEIAELEVGDLKISALAKAEADADKK